MPTNKHLVLEYICICILAHRIISLGAKHESRYILTLQCVLNHI